MTTASTTCTLGQKETNQMKINKILFLNTKHLSAKTLKMLYNDPNQFTFANVYQKHDGLLIYINPEWFYDAIHYGQYPADLKAIMDFAIHCECDVLCVDDATDLIMCLPHYEYRFDVPVPGGNPGETCTVEEIWCGGGKIAHNILKRK